MTSTCSSAEEKASKNAMRREKRAHETMGEKQTRLKKRRGQRATKLVVETPEARENRLKIRRQKHKEIKQHETEEMRGEPFVLQNGNITGGEFVIDMNSIACTDLEGDSKGQLEGHLKSDDFFGVENHPTANNLILLIISRLHTTCT